jgi:hypothetical protein
MSDNNNNNNNNNDINNKESNTLDGRVIGTLNAANDKLDEKFVDWTQIEKPVSNFDKKVLECMLKLGTEENTFTLNNAKIKVAGEFIFTQNIKKLENWNNGLILEEDDDEEQDNKNKKKTKKAKNISATMSKADKIRYDNTFKSYNKDLDEVLSLFNEKDINIFTEMRNTYIIELRGVGLMQRAHTLVYNFNKYNKPSKMALVYELIVAMEKFILNCENFVGMSLFHASKTEKVSPTMIKELSKWSKLVQSEFKFNGCNIYKIAPKLHVFTNFDSIMPKGGIQPRENQLELIEYVKDNLKDENKGFLVFLKAMIGSGKTLSVIAIVHLLRHLRKTNSYKYLNNMQIIFCCNIESVKLQVATLALSAGIKIGMGHVNPKLNKIRIVNQYNCRKDSERELIICSPNVATELLKENDHYLLFLDEPNTGAEHMNSDSLVSNATLMRHMPRYSILSSATLSDIEHFSYLIELNNKRHEQYIINTKTIYSNRIEIGCDVKTKENLEYVIPHIGCKTSKQLKNIINTINKNPFLGRMLTAKVANKIYKDLRPYFKNSDTFPKVRKLFKNPNNLTSDRVREITLDMFEHMTQLDDATISVLCESKIYQEDDDMEEAEDLEEEKELQDNNFDINKMVTSHNYKYQNMNLIVTNDPVSLAISMAKDLLDDLTKDGYNNLTKMYQKYKKDLDTFEKQNEKIMAKLEKQEDNSTSNMTNMLSKNSHNIRSAADENRVRDYVDRKFTPSGGKISVNSELSEKFSAFQEKNRPNLKFPSYAQIGTLEHLKKYCQKNIHNINIPLIAKETYIETLPFESNVTDVLLLLLACRIGIYSPVDKQLDNKYISYVLDRASTGDFAFLITDGSISYGTNYPISRVIVSDDFAESYSINTLFQLFGRAGRVGQSWIAEVFISNKVSKKILDYVNNPNDRTNIIESINIQETIKQVIEKENNKVENKIDNKVDNKVENKIDNKVDNKVENKRESIVNAFELQKKLFENNKFKK